MQSVDRPSTECWPITDRYIGQVSTNYRRSVGERKAILAETHLEWLSTVSWLTIDRYNWIFLRQKKLLVFIIILTGQNRGLSGLKIFGRLSWPATCCPLFAALWRCFRAKKSNGLASVPVWTELGQTQVADFCPPIKEPCSLPLLLASRQSNHYLVKWRFEQPGTEQLFFLPGSSIKPD